MERETDREKIYIRILITLFFSDVPFSERFRWTNEIAPLKCCGFASFYQFFTFETCSLLSFFRFYYRILSSCCFHKAQIKLTKFSFIFKQNQRSLFFFKKIRLIRRTLSSGVVLGLFFEERCGIPFLFWGTKKDQWWSVKYYDHKIQQITMSNSNRQIWIPKKTRTHTAFTVNTEKTRTRWKKEKKCWKYVNML